MITWQLIFYGMAMVIFILIIVIIIMTVKENTIHCLYI